MSQFSFGAHFFRRVTSAPRTLQTYALQTSELRSCSDSEFFEPNHYCPSERRYLFVGVAADEVEVSFFDRVQVDLAMSTTREE
jgi:hypothetical protein